MFECCHCKSKSKQTSSKELSCPVCRATWTFTGIPTAGPKAPDGTLWVMIGGEEYFGPNDVEAWGGLGIRRGNIIEFQ